MHLEKNKKKGSLSTVVMLVSGIVFLSVVGIFVFRAVGGRQAQKQQEELKELYTQSSQPLSATQETPVATEEPFVIPEGFVEVEKNGEKIIIHKDFAELFAENADIIAWLKAGDGIDYPIVWKEDDNDFYLNNNFNREPDSNGVIFMNMANSLEPRDDILLLHGHNMSSGAMFGTLLKFESYDYLKQYPVVSFRTIYDAEEVYYTPVAGFNASMMEGARGYFDIQHILFDDTASYSQYLDEITTLSLWQSKADVTPQDKLIALITCSYIHDDGRFILFCRALRDGESPESVAEMYKEEVYY